MEGKATYSISHCAVSKKRTTRNSQCRNNYNLKVTNAIPAPHSENLVTTLKQSADPICFHGALHCTALGECD